MVGYTTINVSTTFLDELRRTVPRNVAYYAFLERLLKNFEALPEEEKERVLDSLEQESRVKRAEMIKKRKTIRRNNGET